jgi:hypothetical protein
MCRRAVALLICLLLQAPTAARAAAAHGGAAARSRFTTYTTCGDCVGAGFGWSTAKRRCGGFSNKACPSAAAPEDGAPALTRQETVLTPAAVTTPASPSGEWHTREDVSGAGSSQLDPIIWLILIGEGVVGLALVGEHLQMRWGAAAAATSGGGGRADRHLAAFLHWLLPLLHTTAGEEAEQEGDPPWLEREGRPPSLDLTGRRLSHLLAQGVPFDVVCEYSLCDGGGGADHPSIEAERAPRHTCRLSGDPGGPVSITVCARPAATTPANSGAPSARGGDSSAALLAAVTIRNVSPPERGVVIAVHEVRWELELGGSDAFGGSG